MSNIITMSLSYELALQNTRRNNNMSKTSFENNVPIPVECNQLITMLRNQLKYNYAKVLIPSPISSSILSDNCVVPMRHLLKSQGLILDSLEKIRYTGCIGGDDTFDRQILYQMADPNRPNTHLKLTQSEFDEGWRS